MPSPERGRLAPRTSWIVRDARPLLDLAKIDPIMVQTCRPESRNRCHVAKEFAMLSFGRICMRMDRSDEAHAVSFVYWVEKRSYRFATPAI